MNFKGKNYWALILGGSSGFGLATAHKLSEAGMNVCVVHRDRRGSMARIEEEFEKIRARGNGFLAVNTNALTPEGLQEVFEELTKAMGPQGKIRLLMHSIAFGNLKLIAPQKKRESKTPAEMLAEKLGLPVEQVQSAANELFDSGNAEFIHVADPAEYSNERFIEDEDMANTIYAMGSSMLTWTKTIFDKGLFAPDARVIGMTSEGNEIAWRGYAAVSSAKVTLESNARQIALELGPYGVRANIIQAGVTETPALRLIPGNRHLVASALLRNPLGRLTRPEDVAGVIALLATDEAGWINGTLIRVDGGEHISG